jgi:hypothetical protein
MKDANEMKKADRQEATVKKTRRGRINGRRDGRQEGLTRCHLRHHLAWLSTVRPIKKPKRLVGKSEVNAPKPL